MKFVMQLTASTGQIFTKKGVHIKRGVASFIEKDYLSQY